MITSFAALAATRPSPPRLDDREIRRNLRWLQIFRIVAFAEFTFATIVIFFQENGLSSAQIFWIFGALGGAGVVFEVPSGWLADRFGRKWCLLLSALLMIVGFVVEAVSHEFLFLLIANGLIGAGYSFLSGSDSALAYDSILNSDWGELTSKKIHEAHQKIYGRFERMSQFYTKLSAGVGIMGGTWIAATGNVRLTLWVQIPVYCLLVPIALLLREAGGQDDRSGAQSDQADWSMLQTAKYVFYQNKSLRKFILYFALIGTFGDIFLITMPIYSQLVGISVSGLGWLTISVVTVSGIGGLLAHHYEKQLGARTMWWPFILVPCSVAVLWAALPLSIWVLLPGMIGVMFIFGIFMPCSRVKTNSLTISEVRATILSIRAGASRLIFLSTAWLVGLVIDTHSLPWAMILSVLLYGLSSVLILLSITRKTRLN